MTKIRKAPRRAAKRLAARVKAWEETCRRRSDNGKGFHKPGSNKR